MEDDQIIALCRLGNQEAFAEIVDRYQAKILSLSWSLLGSREEAEDATQEAFLRAFRNISGFAPPHNFRSWLFAIGYRGCLDRLKKRKTERRFQPSLAEMTNGDMDSAGLGRPLDKSSVVGTAWNKLGAKERLALSLAVIEGYSAAEIGQVLGCAENTARVHIFNAKKRMRRWLEGKRHV
jgi:RNA polymerase sigma-70 factor (ECF subfamily)